MSPEAWTFLGIAITAVLAFFGTLIVQHYTTKRELAALKVVTHEGRDAAREAATSTKPISNGTIPAIQGALERIERGMMFQNEVNGRTVSRLDGLIGEVRELRSWQVRHETQHARRLYRDQRIPELEAPEDDAGTSGG